MRLLSLLRCFLLSPSLFGLRWGAPRADRREEVPPCPQTGIAKHWPFQSDDGTQRRGLKDDMPSGSRCRQVVIFSLHRTEQAQHTHLAVWYAITSIYKFCASYLGQGADPPALRPARAQLSCPPTSLVACHSKSAAARSRRAPPTDSQCRPSTMTDLTTCPVESSPCSDRA